MLFAFMRFTVSVGAPLPFEVNAAVFYMSWSRLSDHL